MARWPRLLSLVVGISILGAAATAPAQTARTNKVLIYPNATDTIQDLKSRGATNIRDYGSYWLAEATDSQLAALQAKFGERVGKANYLNVIELQTEALDTATTAVKLPSVASGRQLALVQFAGPIVPAWVEELKRTGAEIVSYIPNNAYLVRVDAKAAAALQNQLAPKGPVQWVGEYRPEYKIQEALRGRSGLVSVRVAVAKDNPAALHQVRTLATSELKPAQEARNEILLTVQVPAGSIPSIAALPDVVRVEAAPQYGRKEEQASLIAATFTNVLPGRTPPPGTDYIDFLLGLGFSTDSEQYPIVDVADSGLDKTHPLLEDLYVIHPDFYEFPVPTVEIMIASTVDPAVAADLSRRSRIAYRTAGDDADGHGTLVASIVAGAGNIADETINRHTIRFEQECTAVTNTVNVTTNIVVCFPIGSEIQCTNFISVTPTTQITNVCDEICIIVTNPPAFPPWPQIVSKTDLNGFRLGTGVNPFGRIGSSPGGAEGSFPGPQTAILRAYIGRARISNNSWGQILVVNENDGIYDSDSLAYDQLTRDAILNLGATNTPGPSPLNQEMIMVFAGGNANGVGAVGGFGDVLVTPPATAKNIITVGASENVRPDDGCLPFLSDQDRSTDISYFNSFGPTRDGRFKPDIVAPGASIFGANSQATYTPLKGFGPNPNAPEDPCGDFAQEVDLYTKFYTCGSGTSFAAPAVAGATQLLWWWVQNELGMLPPSPALAKAYLLNAARYLETQNPLFPGALDTLPSIAQGMGMLDLQRMFDRVSRVVRDQSTPRALDTGLITTNPVPQQTYFSRTGQSYELEGLVASNDLPFRVTLAWTDAPGDPNNFVQLVNNLELEVTIGGKLYKGNVFAGPHSVSVAQSQFDDVNNVESVFLPAGGAVTSGAPYKVVVRAFNIAGDGVPNVGADLDQDFALVVYNAQTNDAPSDVPNLATNDACQTAWDLTAFPAVITNTVNKTNYRNVHPSPAAARGGVEAFFKIETPTPGTTFNITTTGSQFNPVLSVWRVRTVPQTVFIGGKCGALVEVTSTNVPGLGNSALSFTADGSNTYFIVAEPFNNGNGGRLVLNVNASAPLISASPAVLDLGETMVGLLSDAQTVTFANNSPVNVYVSDVTVTGDFVIETDGCSGSLIPPGGTCTVRVLFAPTATGVLTGQLIITDDATGSPRVVELSGTGVAPSPLICLSSGSAIVFTNTAVGELSADSPKTLILTNCGQAVLNVTNVVVTGIGSNDFAVVQDCIAGSPIAVDGTCTFSIQFTPVTNGTRAATLRIFSDASATPATVTLQGTGFIRTPAVCLNKTSLDFSGVSLGESSEPISVTVSNCGTTNLVVSGVGISGANAAEFAVFANSCGTVEAGSTCSVSVVFTPADIGTRTATLAITNDASGSPHLVTLTGSGLTSQPDGLIGRYGRLFYNRRTGQLRSHIGDNIYNADGTNQSLVLRGVRGRLSKYYVPIQNDGTAPEAFQVTGGGNTSEYSVRYFLGAAADGVEVTDMVTSGTYLTSTLNAGAIQNESTMLRVEVRLSTNATRGVTNTIPITVTSTADPSKVDRVNAVVITR